MVALQIRDVPDGVRDVLARLAEERGQSLQAYLLALVKAQVAQKRNSDLIKALRATGGGSQMTLEEINELKEQSRAEWDRGLSVTGFEER